MTAISKILNMEKYLTFSRVDRHEISFRVEKNPDNKSAADIARAVTDKKFRNTLYRLFGVSVTDAGVGDKVNSNNRKYFI